MVNYFFKSVHDSALKNAPVPRAGIWVHVIAPTNEEIQSLITSFDLDESIVLDIKDFFEFPRYEYENNISYFFTRYPYDADDREIDTAPILIIVGESFLITIAEQDVPFLQPFIDGKKEIHTTQKTKLFLLFLASLTQIYDKKLTRMRKNVYRDMGRLRTIRLRDIQRLVFYEQELNEMISAIVPTNVSIQQLTKGNYIQLFPDDRDLMEDLLIGNAQLVESAKSVLKTIQNIRDTTEAMLTQNLNNTIRMLTAFTIVLTIPTLISSLFGMNVVLPLEHTPHAFSIIILLIICTVSLTVYFFMKNRWI